MVNQDREKQWGIWEPRVTLPTFARFQNIVSFVINDTFDSQNLKSWARPAYYYFNKRRAFKEVVRDYKWLLLQEKIKFRGYILNRSGEVLHSMHFADEIYAAGDFFKVDVNELRMQCGSPDEDGLFLLVATRGRTDLFRSSPGSVSMTYVNNQIIGGFRTGFFAREFNVRGHTHYGFTGINPKVRVDNGFKSSVLLVNHSSDVHYDRAVNPHVRLYRSSGDFIDTQFGEIPPHGALEKNIEDLFPDAKNFLEKNDGWGCSVATAKGSTLASYHIVEDRAGTSFAIDHSRPSHPNVIDYLSQKKKARNA